MEIPAETKIVRANLLARIMAEANELIVRSPVMMQGYFKDEEMTRQAIRDGWLYTGDHVYREENGYLFFVDRKKDIIRRKEESISATEIEITLLANPKVQEAAVIAVPSELGEDEVLTGIVLLEKRRKSDQVFFGYGILQVRDWFVGASRETRERAPYPKTERPKSWPILMPVGLPASP